MEPSYTASGKVNWCSHYVGSLKKLKTEFLVFPAVWSNNPTPGTSGENYNLKRYMYPNVHSSSIYNSQDMEATLNGHWQING